MAVSLVSTGITFPDGTTQTTRASQVPAFTNRIINGAMTIDQRNAGASVTPTHQQYTLDRWLGFVSGNAGAYSVAQSTTAPSGFYNSMLITSNANTTLGSTDYYIVAQRIEQNNLFDLGWGASGASSVTLSFKVYSSVAGTFNGYLYAYTATQQSYPFTYTVSSPNTWTSVSVVIPGPTTGGLFSSPTSQGLIVGFTLGTGSSYATLSSPAWTSSFQGGLSGGSNFLATSGNVIYITGVQLEKGSTATSFDYRPFGTELALCQRYYEVGGYNGTGIWSGNATTGVVYYYSNQFVVAKRASATTTVTNYGANGFPTTASTIVFNSVGSFLASRGANATSNGAYFTDTWVASAEL